MRFKCEVGDIDYIERAPLRFINTVDLKAPPEEVFAALRDPDTWLLWFPDMTSAVWEGEPGVGTDRVVKAGPMAIREHFVVWREPHQMAFYISETSLPFAKRMVENYTIEQTSTGSRFTYAVGMQPRFPLSVVKFAVKAKFGKMFQDAVVGFEKYMHQRH
jgi:uncharacterized protein YndB with AHSA1/START domain